MIDHVPAPDFEIVGGNDPAIVLPDVDAKEVAPKIFNAAMFNTGQVCVAVKRVFVHDSKYEDMVEAMKADRGFHWGAPLPFCAKFDGI